MSPVLVLAFLLAASTAHAQDLAQTTHGWCSPAVADTQGDVTINCHEVDPRALARLNEVLDKKDIELEEKIREANQWVERYNELLASAADDPELQELIRAGELDEAGAILDRRIAEQEAVTDRLAENHFRRGEVFELQFRRLDALPHYERAYRYRPENLQYAFQFARALQEQNRFRQSEGVYTEVLQEHRRLAEANPEAYLPDLAGTLNNLGNLYRTTGRFAEAEAASVEARDNYRRLAEANPEAYLPDLAMTLNNLGVLYWAMERFPEAEVAYAEAIEIRRGLFQEHPSVYRTDLLRTLTNMADLYGQLDRDGDAEVIRREIEFLEDGRPASPEAAISLPAE